MGKKRHISGQLNKLIKKRWSPRAFSDKPVEAEKLRLIFEAARWAPSSFNEQPWHFLIASKNEADEFEKMASCLNERNRQWAARAPLLIIPVAKMLFSRNDKPNRHAFHDVGLSVENMILQAVALNVYAHQMAGFSADRAREVFQIPAGFEAVSMITMGYRGDPEELPDGLRQSESAESKRKPLNDFIFAGKWGKTAGIAD